MAPKKSNQSKRRIQPVLQRFEGNPISAAGNRTSVESKAVFNPAAIYEGGKVHILYRGLVILTPRSSDMPQY